MLFTIKKTEKLNIAKSCLDDTKQKLEEIVSREPILMKDFTIESFIPETDFKFFEDRFFNEETKAWEETSGVMSSEKRHLNPLVELHARVDFLVTCVKQCKKKIKELGHNV